VLGEANVTVRADERRFTQVLLNLLSNAVKFTPPGGTITLASAGDAGGGVVVRVEDTGIGIAPENISRVLAPFEQVESGNTRRYDGTGLGLPLAKKLVELHGGTLAIDSALGAGTRVEVKLPASCVVAPAELRLAI
jgi:signal transduction histidine kinase